MARDNFQLMAFLSENLAQARSDLQKALSKWDKPNVKGSLVTKKPKTNPGMRTPTPARKEELFREIQDLLGDF